MNKRKLFIHSILSVGLAVGLSACGGGSSSSSPVSDDDGTQSGQFLDSAVGGLEYASQPSGISGLTDDEGRFEFLPGDEITFSVGVFHVGTTEAADLITPVTLIPESNGSTDDPKVTNIARFLQSLDDDGTADNGITINDATRLAARNQNPTDVADADLDSQVLKDAITAITENNPVPRTDFIPAEEARAHLDGTLATIDPVSACSDERAETVDESRLQGKAFGFIRSDERGVLEFFNGGTFQERSFDEERTTALRDEESEWSVDTINETITLGGTTFRACITDTFLLIEEGNTDNDEFSRFFSVQPYTIPEDRKESFLVNFDGVDESVLSVSDGGSLERFSGEDAISTESQGSVSESSGALKLDFQEGDIIREIFFIAGQGKKTGIFLDFNSENEFSRVGIATITPAISTDVSPATFEGNTLILRDADQNEIIILDFINSTTYRDYSNDFFQNGEQQARFMEGRWSLNEGILSLDEDGEKDDFKVAKAANKVFFAEQDSPDVFTGSTTRPIQAETIPGSYTVDIPTENTRFRELVIRDDNTLAMSPEEGTWSINDGVFEFEIDTREGFIWQIAGKTNAFAFVMIDQEDENDIEPGFMIRN